MVARLLRARGNKGEIAAELTTDFPERMATRREVYLSSANGPPRPASLKSFWVSQNHKGQGVFHFAGCDSIDEAEKLRGLEVLVPFEERVSLPEGRYFVTDLIGCQVWELGRPVGTVRDVYFPGELQPGTPLLAVDTPAGELLVPLAQDICTRIDIEARRIEVLLPAGLRDVDRT